MREKYEDQSLKPDECTSEESKLTKRKITYTRSCLLSLHDWETCCDLPSDFDSSLLQELYDDGSIGALERPNTECSMSIYSSDDSEYGLSRSFRYNDEDLQGKFTKWVGHSSWGKNKDSNSERNSNPGMKKKDGHITSNQESEEDKYSEQRSSHIHYERSYKDRQVFSSGNRDKDGIQGIPAFCSVSESTAAVSSPVVQVEYQLKKCDNPYCPPHMHKGKNGKVKDTLNSGKGSSVTSSSDEQQNVKLSPDRDQTGTSGIRMNNSPVNILSPEEVPDSLNCLSSPSSEAINKSEVWIDQENTFTNHGDEKVIGGMNSDQDHEGMFIKEVPGCAVKSSSSTILSKNHDVEADNTMGSMLHHNKLNSSCIKAFIGPRGRSSGSRKVEGQANGMYDGFVTEHDATEASTGKNGPTDKPMASRLPTSRYGVSAQTYCSLASTETQDVLISAKEQSILSDGNESNSTRNQPAKEHKVYKIEYEQLNPADSAAFSERDMGFSRSPHFKEMESGSNYINQNTRGTETLKPTSRMDFLKESMSHEPDFPIQIGSINLNVGQDGSECSGTQFPDVDDGFLLSILDDSGAFEKSGDCFLLSILEESGAFDMCGEIIRARKNSMEPKENENEDEDIDYQKIWDKISSILTTEQVPKSSPLALPDGEVDFNELCLPDEDSLITINDLISPLSLEPPNEITTLPLNPTAEIHAHDSRSELSSGQGYTAPPCILPWNNIPPPPNPNLYKNPVYYSVLGQPGNLVQQTEGATYPDPMKQLGCYNDGPRTTYFYPHNFLQPSYQMFRMPNPDFGGNNSRAIVNGSGGMHLEAGPMHPFGRAGYGHRYRQLCASEFQIW